MDIKTKIAIRQFILDYMYDTAGIEDIRPSQSIAMEALVNCLSHFDKENVDEQWIDNYFMRFQAMDSQ